MRADGMAKRGTLWRALGSMKRVQALLVWALEGCAVDLRAFGHR